jgi:hypothetical protein
MIRFEKLFALSLIAVAGFSGCNSGGSGSGGPTGPIGSSPADKPCDVFTMDVALGLGNGPYDAGQTSVLAPVSICTYTGKSGQAPNILGATARFEKMSASEFTGNCKAPVYNGVTLGTAQLVSGTECIFQPGGEGDAVEVAELTSNGWEVAVATSTQAQCEAAIAKMIPSLP